MIYCWRAVHCCSDTTKKEATIGIKIGDNTRLQKGLRYQMRANKFKLVAAAALALLGAFVAPQATFAEATNGSNHIEQSQTVRDGSTEMILARLGRALDVGNMREATTLFHLWRFRSGTVERLNPQDIQVLERNANLRALLEPVVINWASGNIPEWIALIGESLQQDETIQAEWPQDAEGLGDLRFQERLKLLRAVTELQRNRDRIYLARELAGAPIRDPAWTKARAAAATKAFNEAAEEGYEEHRH